MRVPRKVGRHQKYLGQSSFLLHTFLFVNFSLLFVYCYCFHHAFLYILLQLFLDEMSKIICMLHIFFLTKNTFMGLKEYSRTQIGRLPQFLTR